MKMRFILPLMASVALATPAFAQTSPQSATPEPAMQDQSTPAPMAKHMKAKTKTQRRSLRHPLTIRPLRSKSPYSTVISAQLVLRSRQPTKGLRSNGPGSGVSRSDGSQPRRNLPFRVA
jgi:hypothetical protein